MHKRGVDGRKIDNKLVYAEVWIVRDFIKVLYNCFFKHMHFTKAVHHNGKSLVYKRVCYAPVTPVAGSGTGEPWYNGTVAVKRTEPYTLHSFCTAYKHFFIRNKAFCFFKNILIWLDFKLKRAVLNCSFFMCKRRKKW